jgi:hypothetical protein
MRRKLTEKTAIQSESPEKKLHRRIEKQHQQEVYIEVRGTHPMRSVSRAGVTLERGLQARRNL